MASLFGAVQRHARWRDPTEAETAAAVNELKEILAGRNDAAVLLAETAGLISASVRAPRMSRGPRTAARFCLEARFPDGHSVNFHGDIRPLSFVFVESLAHLAVNMARPRHVGVM